METLALVFTLLSVVLHVSWNLLGKKSVPSLAFFGLAIGCSALIFSPILILDTKLILLPTEFWLLILLTGALQTMYMAGLAWAYSRGEISVIYPIARALPVMLVPLFSVFLLSKSHIDVFDWLAFLAITLGALMLPIDRALQLSRSTYFNAYLGYAFMAAIGTTGYSIVDGVALNIMLEHDYKQLNAGLTYMVLQAVATIIWSAPIVLIVRSERDAFKLVISNHKLMFLVTGIIITFTYGLVLIAITYARDVSYVVAIRQLSIPLSVILGIYFYKEKRSILKSLGTLLIMFGVVSVALVH